MIESTSVTGGWMFYVVPMLTRRSPYSSADASVVAPLSSCLILTTLALVFLVAVLSKWAVPGGSAWGKLKGSRTIPGPRGWPVIGSLLGMGDLAHRHLAELAKRHGATRLMALSLGETRVVITSTPEVARELLNSASFADRPLKQSAQQLLFERAIGFAPYGEYWRKLRRIASNHLFAPKRIAAHEPRRQLETSSMLNAIREDYQLNGAVHIRKYLQRASLNNIMSSVFGLRYRFECGDDEADQLQAMVRQGFELLGAFNWADHLPVLQAADLHRIHQRCANLVPQVKAFVSKIINEHRQSPKGDASESDFVDVLLSLQGEDKLNDDDMIAVLWEMIFRGTDTTAILTEWILAELVIHPNIQRKVHVELDAIVGSSRAVVEADIPKLSYLQAVVKETLRLHPPGPLLSWARLAVHDVDIAGHWVPAGTTAMVNMWAITHDAAIWNEPHEFKPERFVVKEGGIEFDVRGNDLRLAPFGAGRRVCPGRALGLATVYLWMARLLHHYEWKEDRDQPVNLEEVLKLSCEMKFPLAAIPVERVPVEF